MYLRMFGLHNAAAVLTHETPEICAHANPALLQSVTENVASLSGLSRPEMWN